MSDQQQKPLTVQDVKQMSVQEIIENQAAVDEAMSTNRQATDEDDE